tara:strand:+ start:664 stop:819 length:156 start_codon:yes stop_codon:yes gene_type:complete
MDETTAILSIFIIAATVICLYLYCRDSIREKKEMQGKINRAKARIEIRYNL